jgi:hypothetical protein
MKITSEKTVETISITAHDICKDAYMKITYIDSHRSYTEQLNIELDIEQAKTFLIVFQKVLIDLEERSLRAHED